MLERNLVLVDVNHFRGLIGQERDAFSILRVLSLDLVCIITPFWIILVNILP